MSDDVQPRHDNGTYGSKHLRNPEIHLAENVDGSFLFPPNRWPGGAEQYIDFWQTQPISDDALTTFVSSYAAHWDDWAIPLIREHLHMWGNSLETEKLLNKGMTVAEAEAAKRAEKEAYERELSSIRPMRIKTTLARQIARSAQVMQNLGSLASDAERETAAKAVMHVSQGGEVYTAEQLWDRYRLHEIMPDAFYARENAVYRKLSALNNRI